MTQQRVTLPTHEGEAEAVRTAPDAPWEIGYPWGDDRFYGTQAEVRARMRRRIADERGAGE